MTEKSTKPQLRFAGFDDTWEQRKLGDIVERVVRKNTNNESSLPLTISAQYGLVDQITYFNNRVASRDVSNYYLVLNGEFAYNKSTSDGFPFGAVKRLDLYEKGVLSTLYIVFSIKNQSEIDSDYLTVFFDTDRWHKGVSERAAEGARNHGLLNISADDFFDIDIFLPVHKEEQVVIGSYLRHLDNLITLHQRKLFLNFAKRNDWEQRKLDEVVDFLDTQRKPLEGSKRVSGPYPYYGASGIVDYVEEYLFDEELILLSEDGANITDRNYPVCFLASGKYWVNNHAHVLKAKRGYENNFICNSMERKDFTPFNTGMAMPKLNQEVCRNIPILCPEYAEQKKIGDYFRNLDRLITLHRRAYYNKKGGLTNVHNDNQQHYAIL